MNPRFGTTERIGFLSNEMRKEVLRRTGDQL